MPTPTRKSNLIGTSFEEIRKGGRNDAFRNSVVGMGADYPVRDLDFQNCVRKRGLINV